MKLMRIFLPLVLSVLACNLFSPRPPATPTAGLGTIETIPPLLIPPTAGATAQAPTTSPAVTLSAGEYTPVLYRRYLSRYYEFQVVGGVQQGSWLPASAVADQVQFEQSYDLYGPDGYAGLAVTTDYGIPLSSPTCGETYIGTDFSTDIPNLIGVAQGWDVTHRPVEETQVDTPVYTAAVADWLVSQGFTLPFVKITRIVRVDLEGDGVQEVFISATSFLDSSGHMTQQGDYSIILMRKLVNGEVVTVPVVADLYTSPGPEQTFPLTYLLASLLDLDQDGILDLIVEVNRWEGGGVMVYQVEGTNVMEALRSICPK